MARWTPKQGVGHLRAYVREEQHDVQKYGKAKKKLLCAEGRRIARSAEKDERKHQRRWKALLAKRLRMGRHLK
jgi:rubrerythrin